MDISTIIGIVCGFMAALVMSFSYFYSKHFLSRPGRDVRQLVILSHLWMGLFVAAIVPFVWKPAVLENWRAPAGASTMVLGYLTAQIFFFVTVRYVPASRLAPILSAKILVVALFSWILLREHIGVGQIAGLALAAGAVVLIQKSGVPLTRKALINVLIICVAFATSDVSIRYVVQQLNADPGFGTSMLTLCLMYMGTAPVVLVLYPFVIHRRKGRQPWFAALGYAIIWFSSGVLLFLSIALIGVVPAVLLQSLRGPLSVAFNPIVTRLGWSHLEQAQKSSSIIRQAGAALLMVAALALYMAG
ncbi:MAG: EamA family transporter [Candidatus Sumerlaeia bacterium]